jgi:hypothetical protein F3_00887|nr:MAG TPA: hypothetical protein [Caudoviricetes sp.]
MVKETVLEIEFQPVFDKWAWRISKQDEDILPRGIFEDKNLKVATDYKPEYKKEINYLYVKGVFSEHDNDIDICSTEEKALLEEKVKAINEKYGIKKRWRANFGGEYCFIDDNFSIKWDRDKEYFVDNRKYENGNYFETKTEAEEYAEYMKQKSLEWHERKGE